MSIFLQHLLQVQNVVSPFPPWANGNFNKYHSIMCHAKHRDVNAVHIMSYSINMIKNRTTSNNSKSNTFIYFKIHIIYLLVGLMLWMSQTNYRADFRSTSSQRLCRSTSSRKQWGKHWSRVFWYMSIFYSIFYKCKMSWPLSPLGEWEFQQVPRCESCSNPINMIKNITTNIISKNGVTILSQTRPRNKPEIRPWNKPDTHLPL